MYKDYSPVKLLASKDAYPSDFQTALFMYVFGTTLARVNVAIMSRWFFLQLIVLLFIVASSVHAVETAITTTIKKIEFIPEERSFTKINIKIRYSQSADVWKTVGDVKRAEGNLPAINDVLREKYGKPEEAFSKITIGIDQSLGHGSYDRVYLEAGAEALGFGLVQNPVVPELHANGIAIGTVNAGYTTYIQGPGLDLRIGAAGGMGREKRIDAISTDLIDKIPVRNGAVTMYGFDLDLNRRFEIDSEYAINAHGGLKETIFETTTPSAAIDEDQKQTFVAHRWKTKVDFEKQLVLSGFDKSSISLEGIGGPQPIPVDFLPRSWDYVHNLYPLPELGTMFGAGLYFKGTLSQNLSLESHAGFYGGYVGGDISGKWKNITLTAASWAIETTSAYHVLGERFWQASLGFSF